MNPVAPLALLMLLVPFEPLEPLVRIFGFEVSHLEASALVLLGATAALVAYRRPRLPIPLIVPALLFLLAFLVSAGFAEGSHLLPLKFACRMGAAFLAFVLASLALSATPRFPLLFLGLTLAGAVTAGVALLEVGPWSFDDSLVAPFREHAFEVGGRTRAASTFSYPNTAGGFLVLALAPTLYFSLRERGRALAALASCAMVAAILLTHSRGALLGAAASALLFWWLVRFPSLLRLEAVLLLITAGFFVFEPSYRWRVSSEGDRGWYEARIEPRATSLDLEPRELAESPVRISNVGKLTWGSRGEKPFHLSYRWFRVEGSEVRPLALEGERTRLDEPLKPGETLDVAATVRAPPEPGEYVLIWDMVHEHTTWFSDKVGLGVPVKVAVGGAKPGAAAAPAHDIRGAIAERSWRPGRAELWAIAAGLFRAHPLFGVGPDNFRWLYGPASGHAAWDTRVFSNSLYLELLATVGLFGFAAFTILVARALSGLRRRATEGPRSLEAAALAASLFGFLVHGLFDYLLAFTSIYLVVFVLLGATSALLRSEASP